MHCCVQAMREGVVRDIERQEMKQRNIKMLEEQIELTQKLRAMQQQQDQLQTDTNNRNADVART